MPKTLSVGQVGAEGVKLISATSEAAVLEIDGKRREEFPMTLAELSRAEPVYETMPGWDADLCGMRRFEDLPDAARRYVERIEALVGVPVDLLSVGPGRDQTIARRDPFRI